MKKAIFCAILVLLSVSSFADKKISNRYLFIEGTADTDEHLDFFMTNFQKEAGVSGYTVTEKKNDASHTFKFVVSPAVDRRGDPLPEAENNKFIARISLIRNADDFEVLDFDLYFTYLDDVYSFTRRMFQDATLYIPALTEGDLVIDDRWKNKWIYLRASFDYPITFYKLKGDDLFKDVALYDGPKENPTRTTVLDHKVMALPGLTIGLEFQLLDFLSIEVNYQLSMEDTKVKRAKKEETEETIDKIIDRDNYFFNHGFGLELKVPIKFENIVLAPYGAFTYIFASEAYLPGASEPNIFNEFPCYMLGGGFQISTKGGKHGAFFIDINYMRAIEDAVMNNPYRNENLKFRAFQNPETIKYERFVIGIGIGYKFGFFDR